MCNYNLHEKAACFFFFSLLLYSPAGIGDLLKCEWIVSISFAKRCSKPSFWRSLSLSNKSSGESSLCTALTEKDWLGQVTFVETNMFSKTLVIIHNALFIKALFPVSWLERCEWSLCFVWIPRSWVCTAGKHIAFVWLIIHCLSIIL